MQTTTATLAVPMRDFLPGLKARAAELDYPVTPTARGMSVAMYYGTLEVFEVDRVTTVQITSKDSVELLHLRDTLDWHLDQAGLKHCITWARMRAGPNPANLAIGRVERVMQISPSFTRVRLGGDYTRFLDGGLHFRLLLGPAGTGWPTTDDTGGTVWPGGVEAWHRPAYTVRKVCPEGSWMEFDIFRHAGGTVNDWADGLRPGDEVALTGPGGTGLTEAPWIGLIGDETALPVIIRMIEGAPAGTQGVATILVPSRADVQTVRTPEGIVLRWAFRDEGATLIEAFRATEVPAGPRYVFFAGEKGEAALAREHGVALGLKRGEIHALAYWTAH
ncbi:siderophore-interacting protein [Falsirhodobacter halotolerans]|uniref:siderophore-interacting protein n=1 Tax=Falsirhodobacter halotolerans TaxID=1146892 RepID=UPI001FD40FAD|nr:siderophore-interacting protein [Falsirhodobacter halotolerans]MCJ8140771.1 siderophore-interacting protein [Falsirhodobacter halotolerans]